MELQLELARIDCTVATKEAEDAWATLDNEDYRRRLIFHTVWKIREFVYNGELPKHSIYDILSLLLQCADNNDYGELWGKLDRSGSKPDFE